MEEQRVRAGAGPIPSAHLGFVDAAKGLGILAVIWGHMDYLWSTSSVWFSSFKLAVFFVVVGLLKAHRYEARGQEESCGASPPSGSCPRCCWLSCCLRPSGRRAGPGP